jgi:prepilin-type N-terminal cleavage/methylation domain-containing protein
MRSAFHPTSPRRRAMTLVELLVVIGILGLLSAVVLPAIGTTTEARRYREAGRSLSTFIARSQSRGINSDDAKGFLIQPLAGDPSAAIDLYFANAPNAYAGQWPQSRAIVNASTFANQLPVSFVADTDGDGTPDPDSSTVGRISDPAFCSTGDLIQFGGVGPFFEFTPPSAGGPLIRMRGDFNQSPRNTAWPRTTASGAPFRILPQPRRASSGLLQLQRGSAIDLAWSCLGGRTLGKGGIIAASAQQAPVAIMFDAAGKPADLIHSGGLRTRITEPLFLLIGAIDAAGNDYVAAANTSTGLEADQRVGANWQYADSVWLCIDHNTGLVKQGPVAPAATTVYESQRFIRLTVGLGVTEQ